MTITTSMVLCRKEVNDALSKGETVYTTGYAPMRADSFWIGDVVSYGGSRWLLTDGPDAKFNAVQVLQSSREGEFMTIGTRVHVRKSDTKHFDKTVYRLPQ